MDNLTITLAFDRLSLILHNGWCKGNFALTSDGFTVEAEDPRACRWCLSGGMQKMLRAGLITYDVNMEMRDLLEVAIKRKVGFNQSIVGFNDGEDTTKDDVLEIVTNGRRSIPV